MLSMNTEVKEKYPDLLFGIMLISNVTNKAADEDLNLEKRKLEEETKLKYDEVDRKSLRMIEPLKSYYEYYKKFKKTYHVEHQLMSIASGSRKIPHGNSIVESMFMSEIKNVLLTAAFDMRLLEDDFQVQLSDGTSSYQGMGDHTKTPPANDIIFLNDNKIIGSIIGGPDHENRVLESTESVLFAIFGVPGIMKHHMENHFDDIERYIQLFSPNAKRDYISIK